MAPGPHRSSQKLFLRACYGEFANRVLGIPAPELITYGFTGKATTPLPPVTKAATCGALAGIQVSIREEQGLHYLRHRVVGFLTLGPGSLLAESRVTSLRASRF